MAQTFTQVPPNSTGNKMDGFSTATSGNVRQTVVVGDPSTDAAVAPVSATNGLAVDNKTLAPGASTAANQSTANTSLGNIDTNAGATTDAAVTGDNSGTLSAKLRGLSKILADVWDSVNHRFKVDGSGVTQPVSAVSLPLPTGASTAAKQPALGTAGTASTDVITVQGIAAMTALKVDGSAVTQPVSAVALPLPTGAATAAKQPALGTAGSPSADVITIQGVTSMTALKVDGSAVTQPVSGAVTVSGTVTASPPTASSATLSNVAGSATSVSLLASNGSRKGAVIFNDSTANLRIAYAGTASSTSFSYFLGPSATWEMPAGVTYTGAISGIWESATGSARVTEL